MWSSSQTECKRDILWTQGLKPQRSSCQYSSLSVCWRYTGELYQRRHLGHFQKQGIIHLQSRKSHEFRYLLKWQFSGWILDQNVGPEFRKSALALLKTIAFLIVCTGFQFYIMNLLVQSYIRRWKANKVLNMFLPTTLSPQELHPFFDCKWVKLKYCKRSFNWIIYLIQPTLRIFWSLPVTLFLLNVSASALAVTLILLKYLC